MVEQVGSQHVLKLVKAIKYQIGITHIGDATLHIAPDRQDRVTAFIDPDVVTRRVARIARYSADNVPLGVQHVQFGSVDGLPPLDKPFMGETVGRRSR